MGTPNIGRTWSSTSRQVFARLDFAQDRFGSPQPGKASCDIELQGLQELAACTHAKRKVPWHALLNYLKKHFRVEGHCWCASNASYALEPLFMAGWTPRSSRGLCGERVSASVDPSMAWPRLQPQGITDFTLSSCLFSRREHAADPRKHLQR